MNPPPRASGEAAPRILLLSMYPLDQGLWGPTTRITQLRSELAARVDLDVISGTRMRRAAEMVRYSARRRLHGLGGIYVESSTALPGPADVAFLAMARGLGIRVLTYVRDAYQLFPEYRSGSLKGRISRLLFMPAMRALLAVSDVAAFPSQGLAEAVLARAGTKRTVLLPPGARVADAPATDPTARAILFVGALKHRASGGATLVEAMEIARSRAPDLRLIAVSRPGEGLPQPHPVWIESRRAEGAEIEGFLPEVLATVIPRPRNAYNDLAIPIKLMDYLGYGRPMIVTDATETAKLVRRAGSGVVTGDDADALAAGIVSVALAEPPQIREWSAAARSAAVANSWGARAEAILELVGVTR